ncbi:hypothetical protein V6N13_010179 [Hibiscus sabdariffa]
MYVGNAPNPYEHPTMAGSSFANPVDDNFYHPQPPIYHPSMGGSSVSNQVDDNIYHPQPPMYHPSMGGSSGANFSESYVPDIYHSHTYVPELWWKHGPSRYHRFYGGYLN